MPAHAIHRLQRFTRHPATWLALLTLVPIAVALTRAISHGWAPEGDDAVIADRMRAVFSAHPPLMGQRSTSILNAAADVPTHHPGPLEYYLGAPIARLFGFSGVGILTSVAVGNAVAATASVVIAFRLRGLRTAIPVTGAVLLLEWSLGPEQLVRPLNVYVAALPMLLLLVAAWALLDGDLAVLWVFALAASFVGQANLAFLPLAVGVGLVLAIVAVWRRIRGTGLCGLAPDRRRRAWLIAGGVLLAAWLPALLELLRYRPSNLQQLLRYRSEAAGTGTSWQHAIAYSLDRMSPWGFGRFHNSYLPAERGFLVAAGAVGVLLLALGAFAGTHRPRTAGSFGCGLALVAIPLEAWALTHMAGLAVGYWLLPGLVIAVFGAAVLVIRANELVPQELSLQLPSAARTTAVGLAGALAVLLASATAAAPSWATEDAARRVTATVTTYLDRHAQPATPVLVQGTGVSALSLDSALGFQLGRKGFDAYYMLPWPVPEDTEPWHMDHAPPTHISVLIAERKADGSWSRRVPHGAAVLDLGKHGGTELRASVQIPSVLAR